MSIYHRDDREQLRAAYAQIRERAMQVEREQILALISAAREHCVPQDATDGVLAEIEHAVRSRGESP